ncbi:M3 family oligoendopeptidase [Halobacillus litoralis]|uniref:Oligoendopeptidase F n=1 Tax=Halobacillus litoralis TaxID=45668 RepID=A0A410M834_9BACI|nr:M3 family oligoendopeptidase [Halobacillus litoralis]QAS50699.1 oligoendopeptidase F [Halobacillus litoralis]
MKSTKSINWDLERLFPGGKRSTKLQERIGDLFKQITETRQNIESSSSALSEIIPLIYQVQEIHTDIFEIDEYVICLSSENVQDSATLGLQDRTSQLKAFLNTLSLEFEQFLAEMDEMVWQELVDHPEVEGIETFLIERRQKAANQLDSRIEKVIHSLSVDGFAGWEDHYEQEFSRLRVPVEKEGFTENLPFDTAFMQAMLSDNRSIRQQTAKSMLSVCKDNEERFASIFNHFAGYRNELYRLRQCSNPIKEMYEQNRISELSVTSMMSALHSNKSLLHQFLKRKAEIIGTEKLNWYDIYAPTFPATTSLSYDQAADIIIQQFHQYSEKLGKFAETAFNDGWIDAVPKEHKRHGAFCASMPNAKESRVLLSFQGHYQDVVTMAHELGHAYHNFILHEQPGFAQHPGTGLAETASTFAENLVLDAAVDTAETEREKLALLEMKIMNGLKYVSYIPPKFEFEQLFYKKRSSGKLSALEITELMEKTERSWFQDSLQDVNPYNWMTIPHFYNTEKAFFNLPYTIGYLFSNGIYALYQQDKEAFPLKYDQLLQHSGNLSMEQLGSRFLQQDLQGPSFWETSVHPLEASIKQYLSKTDSYK